jgi:GMP synthase (glutamine-hydrolysing)
MNSPQSNSSDTQSENAPKNQTASSDALQNERVLVLDFGSQFAQLIARRVRDQNVYCEIVRHDISAQSVMARKPMALIFSGGPSSVYDTRAPKCDPKLFELGIPILDQGYGEALCGVSFGDRCLDESWRPSSKAP